MSNTSNAPTPDDAARKIIAEFVHEEGCTDGGLDQYIAADRLLRRLSAKGISLAGPANSATLRHRVTADTERVTIISVRYRSNSDCVQCGFLCRITDDPAINGAIRSGSDRCYGCEWANESLSERPLAGLTFEQFCQQKGYQG